MTREFFEQIEPFRNLSTATKGKLLSTAHRKSYPAKQFIFMEGDEAQFGAAVLSGRVAMIKTSPNGKELIIELLPAGEVFGVVAFLDQKPFPLSARAQSETTILTWDRATMAALMKEDPALQRGFMEVVTKRFRSSQHVARAIAHDRVETRVASIILALRPKFGNSGAIEISRQEIADLAGITLETASRVVKGFERDGLLDASSVGSLTLIEPETLLKISEQE